MVSNTLEATQLNPSAISPDNCLIAIMNIRTDTIDHSPRGIWLATSGSTASVHANEINWGEYNMTCFKVCDTGFYYDGDTSGGTCILCPLECPSCYNHTSCCADGHAFENGTCTQCASNQFLASSNTSCINCPIGCATCSSGTVCTSCLDGYVVSGESCVTFSTTRSSSSSSSTSTVAYMALVIAIIAIAAIFLILICFHCGSSSRRKGEKFSD